MKLTRGRRMILEALAPPFLGSMLGLLVKRPTPLPIPATAAWQSVGAVPGALKFHRAMRAVKYSRKPRASAVSATRALGAAPGTSRVRPSASTAR